MSRINSVLSFPAVTKNSLWLGVLCLLVLTCSDVIDIPVKSPEQQVVIFGRVTDGSLGNEVSVAFTSPVNGIQEPVSGARLTLLEDGSALAQYVETSPGLYQLDLPNDSARVGRSYSLEVVFADGTTYRSIPTVMPDLAAVDAPYFEQGVVEVEVNEAGLEVKKNLVEFYVDTDILNSGSDTFLKWHLIEAYGFQERIRVTPLPRPPCFVTNEFTGQEVRLFNGGELKVDQIKGELVKRVEIDRRFAFDYYFSVVQTTIDERAYEYWSLINQISNLQGSIFDQTPAPVPGNIRNVADETIEVLGYFEVVRADTTRVRIRANDLNFRVPAPCNVANFEREPIECVNCLALENSTYERPYYWFD